MREMKEMTSEALTIERIIEAPSKPLSVSEAQRLLRSCGILDTKNRVKAAYKDILSDERKQGNENN